MQRGLRPVATRRSDAVAAWVVGAALLTPGVVRAEEVVVHGTRGDVQGHSSRDPTAASTRIDRERMAQPGTTSSDVLERVPGVQVTRSGAGADLATASIRGASAAQTPVYLGGIRLNDDVTGTADLSQVPLWMLDRAEVFRGNAPADADQLGLGGAVFFEPRLPRRLEATAGASVGSFGHRAGWMLGSVGGASFGSGALVGARLEGASNDYSFEDDRGTRFDQSDDVVTRRRNADYSSRDVWTIGLHRVGEARVLTLVNAFDREQGVTGLSVIPADSSRVRVRRLLAGVSARMPCATSSPSCSLELSTSALSASSVLTDPDRELSLGTTLSASRGDRVTQRGRVRVRPSEDLELLAGGEQTFERLAIDNLENSELDARRNVSRGLVAASWSPLPTVEVHGLGALECHSTAGPQGADTCGVLEPAGRLGARVWLSDSWSLLTNVGRYVRVPTLAEVFGISPMVRGNTDLVEETGLNVDLGARAELGGQRPEAPHAQLDAFVFWRRADELIAYRQSSLGVIRPFNVGSARVLGLEALGNLRLFDAWLLEGSVTLLDPRDTTEKRQLVNDVLPYRSRLVAFGRSEVYARTRGELWELDRLSLAVQVSHRASRYADQAGLIVIPDSTTFDLDFATSWFDERLALRAQLVNLFDAQRFDTVGLPLPGRSLFASAELTLR